MRKLALAVPFLLAVAACGSDTKSCSTAPAQLTSLATGCTLAPGATVSLRAAARCDSCAHTNPSCSGEVVSGQIELNPIFQECTEDRSCSGSCTFGSFACTFVTPNVNGQTVNVVYPSAATGTITTTTVTIAAGGQTSCTL